jgi:hypothetical protein
MFDRVATVTLPTGTAAEFPDECVGCGQPSPGHTASIVTRDARHHHAFWAGWHKLQVPSCHSCARRLHLWRWWSFVRTIAVGIAGVTFGIMFLDQKLSGVVTGIIVVSLVGAAFLALFFIDRRFPPSFNIDVRGATTDYEFRNLSYAGRFAALNGASPSAA